MYDVDLFVIGAGSGGVRAARTAANLGAKVAIAEDRYLGGTCVNVGCVPKKLYSYASHFAADFADSAGFGWDAGQASFAWETLRDNKTAEISRLNGIYNNLLENAGVQLINARASITGPHTVQVGDESVSARHILIATGGWPFIPDFPGKEFALSSNEIFDLTTFPKRLLVIGGGYIAVEFAGIFSGLGSKTSLSYRGDKVLRGFDEDVRDRFMAESAKHVDMLMNTEVASIKKNEDGSLHICMKDQKEFDVDVVLSATGRKPNLEGLGLENTAVVLDKRGFIEVNPSFATAEPSIFALGDVVGRMALTPVALAEAMVLVDHLFGEDKRQISYDYIPTAVFSHPNIATVGLSEAQAKDQYGDITVFESDFKHLKHTLSGRDERTYMKVIVATATDTVVGMHMMGSESGEIIQGFASAMLCGLTKAQLDSTLGIHPTAAEEFVTMRSPRP